ncbi:hypothetical protein [Bordetella sp. 2513F-2]
MSSPAVPARSFRAGARLLLCLLLLALGLRALIPLGYMPDAQALREGRLQISFCTAAGGGPTLLHALAQLPAAQAAGHHGAEHHGAGHPRHERHPGHEAHAGHHAAHGAGHGEQAGAQECPFWMVLHQALDTPPAPLVMPLAAQAALPVPPPSVRTLPPLPAAGPPLGPRGPPRRPA